MPAPVSLRLLKPTTLAVLLVLGGGLVALCVVILWALVSPQADNDSGAAGLWVGGILGVFFGLLGLFILYGAIRGRRDTIDVDGTGVRRHGGFLSWSLTWQEVRAVGVLTSTTVRPMSHVPTPRTFRRRRRARLLVQLDVPGSGEQRPGLERMRRGGLPDPFTHAEELPDTTPWARRFRIADTLAEALASWAPDRYRGREDTD